MSLYAAFEWIAIALLLSLSLRLVWRRVIQPVLQRPKAACGSGGCNRCASSK